ncbi:MAG: NADH-quinone oxidoreductase subunit NuoN [Alphaproteobacteria bacterium]|nr:NADH-quinone oxidoreductase subunit NuoN [Alphaproteobacteria bacterium]MCL2505053.1 NADH-quinone oxidoreductase subunit NuoN [Alphaproteobacteria bacterium]
MIEASDFLLIAPEILLFAGVLVTVVMAAFMGDKRAKTVNIAVLLFFALAGYAVFFPNRVSDFMGGMFPLFLFNEQFIEDAVSRFAKGFILIASSGIILLSWTYFKQINNQKAEYPVLIMLAVLGMFFMVSANDFIMLYAGLELQSLALYILAAFNRSSAKSSEAGLKYVILSAISSGVLLYGLSFIYGYFGTTNFAELYALVSQTQEMPMIAAVGMVFVLAALAFKISAVPFHMWAPDVYTGAPSPVTAFFATAPKFAAFILLVRLLFQPFDGLSQNWIQAIIFLSVASMVLGAFAGLAQSNIKRLLAYSSIANVGYLLIGVIAGGQYGLQAVLLYFGIYIINLLGIFAVLIALNKNDKPTDRIEDFSGLSKTNPYLAFCMMILLFSLAGIPPLAGFFAKYFVFFAAVKSGYTALAVIGVLSSVISAYYYLRIIRIMYFSEPMEGAALRSDFAVNAIAGFAAIAMIGFILMPELFSDLSLRVAADILIE